MVCLIDVYIPKNIINTYFTINNCLFWSVNLNQNADLYTCKYTAHGIKYDSSAYFSFHMGEHVEKRP